jgi:hypothetical protein
LRLAGGAEPFREGTAKRLVGLALTAIVLMGALALVTVGDQLAATGRSELALALPAHAIARDKLLLRRAGAPVDATDHALALAALRATPVAPLALSRLADQSRLSGDSDRAARLLELASRLTWHDPVVQGAAIDLAIARADYDRALLHSDALLRQRKLMPEFFELFDQLGADEGFRVALAKRLAMRPPWAAEYLASHSSPLPVDAMLGYLDAYRGSRALDRAVAAPVINALLRAERYADARHVAARVSGLGGTAPGPLPWPDGEALDRPVAFDWVLGPGVSMTADGAALDAGEGATQALSGRLLALPQGTYAITGASAQGGWVWGVACFPATPAPIEVFGGGASFTVGAGCPVQRLSVRPAATGARTPLPVLSIVRR